MQTTFNEMRTIWHIAERAVSLYPTTLSPKDKDIVRESIANEVLAVHQAIVPLRLDEFLTADDANFLHDVTGIHRHLVVKDGQQPLLSSCFRPRFTATMH